MTVRVESERVSERRAGRFLFLLSSFQGNATYSCPSRDEEEEESDDI